MLSSVPFVELQQTVSQPFIPHESINYENQNFLILFLTKPLTAFSEIVYYLFYKGREMP